MGTDGIDYMFQATEGLPIDVRFMLPSCVPATPMDESGANLDYRAIDSFYDYPRVQGLAEMMNAYGVIHNDKEVVSKIVAAQAHHKKIDGHAPGLLGKDLDTYIAAGVYSDHECSTMEDALEKLKARSVHHDPRGYGGAEPRGVGWLTHPAVRRALHVLHGRQAPERPFWRRGTSTTSAARPSTSTARTRS